MSETTGSQGQRGIFFSKQPILDGKSAIWGYELLGAEMREGILEVFSRQENAAGLSSSTYQGLQEAIRRGKKIMVGFDGEGILAGMPHALPPASGVMRLLSGAACPPDLVAALAGLRGEGYQALVDIRPGEPLPQDLSSQADIVAMDFGDQRPRKDDLARVDSGSRVLLARGLKTREQFLEARDMGFVLFQGSFFKEPECLPDRKLGSGELTRLNLFRLMESDEPDIKALSAAIRADVAVSFRLLAFLNSAAFGFRQNIQSIDQAIMLLGWIKLKSWLRAVLLVDMAGKDEVPQELALLSLVRGKFFELLALEYDYWGFNPATLFLLGLFSLMDAILGLPMEEVVEMLPLDAKLKVALRREPDSEHQPLFRLLDCLEDGDWQGMEELCHQLCLGRDRVKEIAAASRNWAEDFFI